MEKFNNIRHQFFLQKYHHFFVRFCLYDIFKLIGSNLGGSNKIESCYEALPSNEAEPHFMRYEAEAP